MKSIFLSHSHADKTAAKRLTDELRSRGVYVWIDEAEIMVGDSLIEKIREGIDKVDYFGVAPSTTSVRSAWVAKELDVAMNQEIEGRRVRVLPILLEDCNLPSFLIGKLYADFRADFAVGLARLLTRLNIRDFITRHHPIVRSLEISINAPGNDQVAETARSFVVL